MTITYKEVEQIINNNTRIPLEYRKNKTKARELLNFIKDNNIVNNNYHLTSLASWAAVDLGSYKTTDQYSEVKTIQPLPKEKTYDLHIKDGNSYVANGIICHNTINLPEDVTVEKVAEIYEAAWKEGCKGMTVYRKNCRTGVLVDDSQKPNQIAGRESDRIIKQDAPKRPNELPALVHHTSVKGEGYFVIVGVLNGDPYEVFAGRNGFIPRSVKEAVVKKVKRGQYEAQLSNGKIVENIADHIDDEQEAVARMTSAALRHGADINFVVQQLEKTKGEMQSFAKAVARALKKHIVDGAKVSGEKCDKCGGENIQRREGCKTCMDCGNAACG